MPATLGLVPDREGPTSGLIDYICSLAAGDVAELVDLLGHRLAQLVDFALGFLAQGVGPLPRLLQDPLHALAEGVE